MIKFLTRWRYAWLNSIKKLVDSLHWHGKILGGAKPNKTNQRRLLSFLCPRTKNWPWNQTQNKQSGSKTLMDHLLETDAICTFVTRQILLGAVRRTYVTRMWMRIMNVEGWDHGKRFVEILRIKIISEFKNGKSGSWSLSD